MPQDLHDLVRATKRVTPVEASKIGFTLCRDTVDRQFNTGTVSLPSALVERILPHVSSLLSRVDTVAHDNQVVEQFSVKHARLLLLGNYDAFLLMTLKDNHTASVSDVFYRDPNLHPQVDVHPPGSEENPVLLELGGHPIFMQACFGQDTVAQSGENAQSTSKGQSTPQDEKRRGEDETIV